MKEMLIKEKIFSNIRNIIIIDKETGELEKLFCTEETALKIAKKNNMIIIYKKG